MSTVRPTARCPTVAITTDGRTTRSRCRWFAAMPLMLLLLLLGSLGCVIQANDGGYDGRVELRTKRRFDTTRFNFPAGRNDGTSCPPTSWYRDCRTVRLRRGRRSREFTAGPAQYCYRSKLPSPRCVNEIRSIEQIELSYSASLHPYSGIARYFYTVPVQFHQIYN